MNEYEYEWANLNIVVANQWSKQANKHQAQSQPEKRKMMKKTTMIWEKNKTEKSAKLTVNNNNPERKKEILFHNDRIQRNHYMICM